MANETITSGSGLRAMRVMLLDSAGYPDGDQSGADGYDGLAVTGIKDISSNIPENQRIQHTGDDATFAQDFLPPTELPSGTFTTGKTNQTLDATLSDTTVQTIGEWEMDGLATDKQGQEASVMAIYWRQARVTDPDAANYGTRNWQTSIFPQVSITPQGNSSPSQGSDDVNSYSMTPTTVTKTPWGVDFSESDNGFDRAVRLRLTSENPIVIERFTGNGTLQEFNLTWTPVTAAKTQAWTNGTAETVASVDTTGKTVTFSGTPANAGKLVVLYETTDAIS